MTHGITEQIRKTDVGALNTSAAQFYHLTKIMEKSATGIYSSSIVIPRPKSVYATRQEDSYRWWMRDYHKHRHSRHVQQTRTLLRTVPDSQDKNEGSLRDSYTIANVPKRSKGTNLFLNFTSLKINPEENENNSNHSCGAESQREPKIESTDTLDGYRIYKGSGNLTLGLSRQNTVPDTNTRNLGQKQPKYTDSPLKTSFNHIIIPTKFNVATERPNAYNSNGAKSNPSHFVEPHILQNPKPESIPSQNPTHPQRQQRPHSATTSHASSLSVSLPPKEKKGSRKLSPKKATKTLPQNFYKTPTITTIELQSSDALSVSPRQNGTCVIASPNTGKISKTTQSKSDANCLQTPRSILKHNKSNLVCPSQMIFDNTEHPYHNTVPASYYKYRHEIPYHEFLVVSNKVTQNLPEADIKTQNSSSHQGSMVLNNKITSATKDVKRPKSATVNPTTYDMLEKSSSSPRRKSVTFNSYVSFLSENRVSTIRSLPIDI